MAQGSSQVDLSSELGELGAPLDFYVGNTGIKVTEEKVKEVLVKCAAGLQDNPVALDVIDVKEIGQEIVNRRTKCWKVTVPYSMKETMQQSSLYPSSWTHRRYFQQREKRVLDAVTLPGGRARVQSAGGAARSEPLQEQEPRGQEEVLAREQGQGPRGEEARRRGQEEPAVLL